MDLIFIKNIGSLSAMITTTKLLNFKQSIYTKKIHRRIYSLVLESNNICDKFVTKLCLTGFYLSQKGNYSIHELIDEHIRVNYLRYCCYVKMEGKRERWYGKGRMS